MQQLNAEGAFADEGKVLKVERLQVEKDHAALHQQPVTIGVTIGDLQLRELNITFTPL